MIRIGEFDVKRVLIDTGSLTDILFHEAFLKMGLPTSSLHTTHVPLVGFTGQSFTPKGIVTLPVTFGRDTQQATQKVQLMVVDVPSPYNMIIRRKTLNSFKCIVSTYHLKVKIPTSSWIGELLGDQLAARECYVNALHIACSGEQALQVETDDPREADFTRPEPMHELEEVQVGPLQVGVKIGKDVHEGLK